MRPHHFRKMFELIGREDIADDPDLQSHENRIKNASRIVKALNETMPSRTTEDWIALLQPNEVFCERVNGYQDYLDHPHVSETGAVDWIEQDGFARMPVANIPGLPPARDDLARHHAPHIGEHSRDILGELGYAAADIEAMVGRKAIVAPLRQARAAE
jgi:crotonobetainyl-CoA:carnitine CoA-transferase CaiB-like acyl-CoA transferase